MVRPPAFSLCAAWREWQSKLNMQRRFQLAGLTDSAAYAEGIKERA